MARHLHLSVVKGGNNAMKKLLLLGSVAGLLLAQTAPPVQKRDRVRVPPSTNGGPATAGPRKTGPQDGTGARSGKRTGPMDGSGRQAGGGPRGRR